MFTNEEMRATILGVMRWRKCRQCDGAGFENWDEDGNDIKSGSTSDQNRCSGECENCNSIGFVIEYT